MHLIFDISHMFRPRRIISKTISTDNITGTYTGKKFRCAQYYFIHGKNCATISAQTKKP